ncbi:YbaN family protein [Pedomonas mirosovicensis]|uniref:YbaN family protein n=1 Tax=Pedomonas mirosovicensis TaxID=2908641 RepID=UPI00216A5E2C|nr:YbaN family protein [Pedomonas mirosovicensis]MCH8686097.1 YbaN family protein [Pedomonas mirosovicensis]
MRRVYAILGYASLVLAVFGAILPLLPTVPFVILAAFFFAKGNPALERRLLEHPTLGPHIIAWREKGAISRKGKVFALITFAGSAIIGFVTLQPPVAYIPALAALIGGTWVATRPTV